MPDQPKPCRTTQHCAVHDFCHRCMPSLDEATQHLVKAIDAAGITTGTGRVYATLAATIRDAARTAARQSKPAAAYTDGKGRIYCVRCAPTVEAANAPLTVDHVDHWELCPSCGRHVIDAARQTTGQTDTEPRETCRAVEADGTTILVRGTGDWTAEDQRHMAEIVAAAKRKYEAEHPAVGQPAEAQATDEAQPPRIRWRVEHHDPLANEWIGGIPYQDRQKAVERLAHARLQAPRWADDGKPVERRLVRETTTWTVEDDSTWVPRYGRPLSPDEQATETRAASDETVEDER